MAINLRATALCALLAIPVAAEAAVPQKERDALVALYNAAGGSNWSEKGNWNGAPGTECGWYGIECDENQTTVARINLGYNGLAGTIPSSIADLSNLTELTIGGGVFSGSIPTAIGSLSKLSVLDLSNSGWSGQVPLALLSLTNLTSLDLGSNALTGAIPPQTGQLTKLTNLNLSYNQLSGSIPQELGSLGQLQYLSLGSNALTGQIPSTIGNLTNLISFDLSNNQLTGPIPSSIGNLTNLTGLYLATNRLSGDIPSTLYNLTKLEQLDLSINQLTGTLSNDLGRLASLQYLRLADNQFSGQLPPSITSLRELLLLELGTAGFTGPIPANIDSLSKLQRLDLGGNTWSGGIPPAIGRLLQLQVLYLYSANLSGTIPPELGSLTQLQVLNLDNNQLTGPVPDLRNLTELTELSFTGNQLTGPFPDWVPQLKKLTYLSFNTNRLSGDIPAAITTLTSLDTLDLGYNVFTGQVPDSIGNLTGLEYLVLADNELTGPLPDSLWNLHALVELRLDRNHFSGTLSPRVAELTKLETLLLGDNEISGTIPAQLGTIRPLLYLQLYGNHLTGTIPPQLGDLPNLLLLDLGSNDLSGSVPAEIRKLTTLPDRSSGWDHNALTTSDPSLLAFLNQKQSDNDFFGTQTLPVTNVQVTSTTDRSATLQWTPIVYGYDLGGYQVSASRTPGGSPDSVATTVSKYSDSITIRNLAPSTTYYFTITSITYPHDVQRNTVASAPTNPVSATTGPRVNAPADIAITTTPIGLVEIDGVAQGDDSFTVANFGDAPTTITLARTEDFFNVSPQTITLNGGASQLVTITANVKPEGAYYGNVVLQGDGVSDDDFVDVTLLSVVKPQGGAIAEALTSRVEIVEQPGIPSAGSVTFRNRGTIPLTGILQADVPWIVPPRFAIQIAPGDTAAVTFTIDATKRPAIIGTLTGTITFVYVGGTFGSLNALRFSPSNDAIAADTSKASATRVTVVDISKPPVAPGTIPPLGPGEVGFAIPGIVASKASGSSVVSDLDVLNAFGSKAISDLRLYFVSSGASTSVASPPTLRASQSLSFANVVANVYGSQGGVGTLQVRSVDWQDILVSGRVLRLGGSGGTVAGDLPVFRSDRAAGPGQSLRLAGMRQGATLKTTLYVEEMTGTATRAHLDFLDASGAKLGSRDADVGAFGLAEIADAVPSGTASSVVRNSGTGGAIVAYGRVSDDASGDSWSVVDWRSYFNVRAGSTLLVPFAQTAGSSGSPGRRRAASHAVSTPTSTELTLFNAATDSARIFVQYGSSQKEIDIAPQTTAKFDVGSAFGAAVAGPLRITQDKGDVAITARTSRPSLTGGTYGAAVPVIAAQSGLRSGQSRVFANIEDPSAATIAAATAGTFRATYGLLETGGAPATVRVSVSLPDGRTIAEYSKSIPLAPNQFVAFDGVVKSIVGDVRDTRFGDFHNLQVKFEVTSGDGSVVPFFVVTENATGDSVFRLE